jgi:hypothetical protein
VAGAALAAAARRGGVGGFFPSRGLFLRPAPPRGNNKDKFFNKKKCGPGFKRPAH